MKKLALALVCFASLAFFASCNKEGQPTIQVLQDQQTRYAQDGDVVDVDTEIDFGFVVASSTVTNKELATLVVDIDGTEWANIDLSGKTEYTYTDYVTYEGERDEIIGTSVITATVTDVAGQTATAKITLTVNQPDVPILGMPIEWKREGSNVVAADAEEMKLFGLQWTGSYKETFATIQPLNDDVILYLCDGDDFDGIETLSDKNAYFTELAETATPIEKYRNITTNNSADYNDMLAIVNGDSKHLILISHATITPITNNGAYVRTDITITGEAK